MLIDATAVPTDRGGVGRYVDSLVAALDKEGAQLTVVCQLRDGEFYGRIAPRSRVVTIAESVTTRAARLIWEQTALPVLVRKLGVDVVHSPHYTMPLASRADRVVTLHDATFFTDALVHSRLKARFFRAWTTTSLSRASRCIVPSASTASELAAVARVHGDGPDVIHHGVDAQRFRPPADREVQAARDAIGIGAGSYVAFLGALEPRKNVPALIRGFTRAVADREEPPTLVLAGPSGWDGAVAEELDAAGDRVRVIRAGYVPFELLAGFLGGADVVAYPSLGEGFGLPVLEAMACGACVLTTPRLALPEIGADAVAYCGVGAGEISAALATLLDQPARRAALGSSAKSRAAKSFRWSVSAQRHRETYDRAWRAE